MYLKLSTKVYQVKKIITIASISLLMQGCVAVPNNSPSSNQPDNYSSRFSVEGIKKREEAKYAQKLGDLSKKNPVIEAQKAIANDDLHLLTFQSGRGGSTTVPGIENLQVKNVNCRLLQLDGMGDSIYGENHLKYRVAIEKYASEFNRVMHPYCR